MSRPSLVSVIIPTHNSAMSLEVCLASIATQSYAPTELLVIDNHSTDATIEIARRMTPLVYTMGPERSAQRNAGARLSRGSYLLFIDSDMVLERDVIEFCVALSWAHPDAAGVIIPEKSVGEGFWASCKALERGCYVGDDTIEAARFFKRAAFDAVGGYDEELTAAEDWDLSQRVQRMGALGRIDAFIEHQEGRLTLRKAMRGKFYYGTTLGRYIRKQPGRAAHQLQFVRPAYLRHWRRLAAHPVLAAGMVVLKGCEFAAGGTGLALAAWRQWWQNRSA